MPKRRNLHIEVFCGSFYVYEYTHEHGSVEISAGEDLGLTLKSASDRIGSSLKIPLEVGD